MMRLFFLSLLKLSLLESRIIQQQSCQGYLLVWTYSLQVSVIADTFSTLLYHDFHEWSYFCFSLGPNEHPSERRRSDTKEHSLSQWFTNFSEADELSKLSAARQQVRSYCLPSHAITIQLLFWRNRFFKLQHQLVTMNIMDSLLWKQSHAPCGIDVS